MHARGSVQVRICSSHNHRHCTASGKAHHKHSVWIGVVITDDLFGDTCNQRRLTAATVLVLRAEPIPVPHGICPGILLGIDDKKVMHVGKFVHACPGRIVEHRLRPAMEHDNDRYALAGAIRGDIDLVSPCAGGVGVRSVEKDTCPKTAWRRCMSRESTSGLCRGICKSCGVPSTRRRLLATRLNGFRRATSVEEEDLGGGDADEVGIETGIGYGGEDDWSVRWMSSVASASRPALVRLSA